VAGAIWRLAAFGFNVWPHGDVVIDAAIAESVARDGRLLVPMVDIRYYGTDRFGFGYPPDQHPPLWPLLGAPLGRLLGDGYAALKVVGLLVGIAVVPVAYGALRPRIGAGPALLTAALAAGSYPLVDFSGNGSLWALLALWYLAWLWALPHDDALAGHPMADEAAEAVTTTRATPSSVRRGASTTRVDEGRGAGWRPDEIHGSRWRLDWRRAELARWALVGVIMGLGYLTNYPAVTLVGALGLSHALRYGRALLRPAALIGPGLALGVMLVTIAPWLGYTWATFGSPIWSQPFQRTLAGGSRQVEYVIVGDEAIKRNLPMGGDRLAGLRERAVDLYGNVGFTARQLLILAPVLSGLFLAGLATVGACWWRGMLESAARRREIPRRKLLAMTGLSKGTDTPASTEQLTKLGQVPRGHGCDIGSDATGRLLPLVALALVHLALILWWPTTKFRYLVPLLPLVFALGAWFVWQLRPLSLRAPLVAVTLGLCLFTNLWTMLSIPSRTYYYDGGLVADNFGQQGETIWMQDTRRLKEAADRIVTRGPGVILGDHILGHFTGQPLVVNSTAYPPEVVAHLVRKYGIRYVVAERARRDQYAFLSPSVLWSDERLVVLELPSR